MRIISIITVVAFVVTNCGLGYALEPSKMRPVNAEETRTARALGDELNPAASAASGAAGSANAAAQAPMCIKNYNSLEELLRPLAGRTSINCIDVFCGEANYNPSLEEALSVSLPEVKNIRIVYIDKDERRLRKIRTRPGKITKSVFTQSIFRTVEITRHTVLADIGIAPLSGAGLVDVAFFNNPAANAMTMTTVNNVVSSMNEGAMVLVTPWGHESVNLPDWNRILQQCGLETFLVEMPSGKMLDGYPASVDFDDIGRYILVGQKPFSASQAASRAAGDASAEAAGNRNDKIFGRYVAEQEAAGRQCWFGSIDIKNLFFINGVFDEEVGSFFKRKVIAIAKDVIKRHGGIARKAGGDEIEAVLVTQTKGGQAVEKEIEAVLLEINLKIREAFKGQYGFVRIKHTTDDKKRKIKKALAGTRGCRIIEHPQDRRRPIPTVRQLFIFFKKPKTADSVSAAKSLFESAGLKNLTGLVEPREEAPVNPPYVRAAAVRMIRGTAAADDMQKRLMSSRNDAEAGIGILKDIERSNSKYSHGMRVLVGVEVELRQKGVARGRKTERSQGNPLLTGEEREEMGLPPARIVPIDAAYGEIDERSGDYDYLFVLVKQKIVPQNPDLLEEFRAKRRETGRKIGSQPDIFESKDINSVSLLGARTLDDLINLLMINLSGNFKGVSGRADDFIGWKRPATFLLIAPRPKRARGESASLPDNKALVELLSRTSATINGITLPKGFRIFLTAFSVDTKDLPRNKGRVSEQIKKIFSVFEEDLSPLVGDRRSTEDRVIAYSQHNGLWEYRVSDAEIARATKRSHYKARLAEEDARNEAMLGVLCARHPELAARYADVAEAAGTSTAGAKGEEPEEWFTRDRPSLRSINRGLSALWGNAFAERIINDIQERIDIGIRPKILVCGVGQGVLPLDLYRRFGAENIEICSSSKEDFLLNPDTLQGEDQDYMSLIHKRFGIFDFNEITLTGQADQMSYSRGQFDIVIIAQQTLLYVHDPVALMPEFRRVLKQGGVLFADFDGIVFGRLDDSQAAEYLSSLQGWNLYCVDTPTGSDTSETLLLARMVNSDTTTALEKVFRHVESRQVEHVRTVETYNYYEPVESSAAAPAKAKAEGDAAPKYAMPQSLSSVSRGLDDLLALYPSLEEFLAGLNPGAKVLFIGPGRGLEILGIEKKYPHLNLNFQSIGLQDLFGDPSLTQRLGFHCGDINEEGLSFYSPGDFDVIIMGVAVMMYVKNKAGLIEEIYQKLKTGGTAFVDTDGMSIVRAGDIPAIAGRTQEQNSVVSFFSRPDVNPYGEINVEFGTADIGDDLFIRMSTLRVDKKQERQKLELPLQMAKVYEVNDRYHAVYAAATEASAAAEGREVPSEARGADGGAQANAAGDRTAEQIMTGIRRASERIYRLQDRMRGVPSDGLRHRLLNRIVRYYLAKRDHLINELKQVAPTRVAEAMVDEAAARKALLHLEMLRKKGCLTFGTVEEIAFMSYEEMKAKILAGLIIEDEGQFRYTGDELRKRLPDFWYHGATSDALEKIIFGRHRGALENFEDTKPNLTMSKDLADFYAGRDGVTLEFDFSKDRAIAFEYFKSEQMLRIVSLKKRLPLALLSQRSKEEVVRVVMRKRRSGREVRILAGVLGLPKERVMAIVSANAETGGAQARAEGAVAAQPLTATAWPEATQPDPRLKDEIVVIISDETTVAEVDDIINDLVTEKGFDKNNIKSVIIPEGVSEGNPQAIDAFIKDIEAKGAALVVDNLNVEQQGLSFRLQSLSGTVMSAQEIYDIDKKSLINKIQAAAVGSAV